MTKRVAESQITKDDIDTQTQREEEEAIESRTKASEEVLASRKIVSVRRSGTSKPERALTTPVTSDSLAPESKSLFSGLTFNNTKTDLVSGGGPNDEPKSLFGGLSGLAKSETKPGEDTEKGLFSSLFAPLDTSAAPSGFGSFSFSAPAGGENASFPSFGGSGETPEDQEGDQGSSEAEQEEEQPTTLQTVIDHGAGEEQVFQSDCKLYKLQRIEDESKPATLKWVEKGIGFVRLIKAESSSFRVVVRMKGVFRLMLNTALIPSVCKAERVGNKSVKFTAVDEDGSIADFRLNLLTEDNQAAFITILPEDVLVQENAQ